MSRKKYTINNKLSLGQRIRDVRTYFHMSQTEFATELNTSYSYLSDVERGKSMPGTDILSMLKHKFQVNINWLITGIGEMFETSYDTSTLSAHDAPTTAYNAETTKLLKAVAEIFASKNDLIKGALKENIVAFHHAVQGDAKITKLEEEARERDRHIAELERNVGALMKVINPSDPNTKAKES